MNLVGTHFFFSKTNVAMWNLLSSYFEKNRYFVTKHHLESYNDFVSLTIGKVIKSMNPFIVMKNDKNRPTVLKHTIEVYIGGLEGNELFFDKPTINTNNTIRPLLPNEARLNDLTYATDLYANIHIRFINHLETNEETKVINQVLERVCIGKIPIMLHSRLCELRGQPFHVMKEMGECPYDQGGYFVIDGKEKVIVAQERNITNQLFINKDTKDPKYKYKGFIRCTAEISSVFPKTIAFHVLAKNTSKRENAITVTVPHIDLPIPVFILFRAMGIESDRAIINCILPESIVEEEEGRLALDFIRASILDANYIYNQRSAREYLKAYTDLGSVEHLEYILVNNLFPNVEQTAGDKAISFTKKALYLGYIVKQLVYVCLGIVKETDRDNYMFKRVGISGFLLGDIFKDFYNSFRVKTRSTIDAKYEYGNWNGEDILSTQINGANKQTFFVADVITNGMMRSMKGNWGLSNDASKQGIVQDINRVSYMSFISHMRRVTSPMDSSIKIRSPHQLNTSQYGIMCPCESPDGASVGLLKNMALLCHVTFDVPSAMIIKAIKANNAIHLMPLANIGIRAPSNVTYLCINNNWIGCVETDKAYDLVHYIRLLKRNAIINIFTSISWNITDNRINILTESGRCCRPLLIVDNGNSLRYDKKWNKGPTSKVGKRNWYSLAKGDSLTDGQFDIYNTNFIDHIPLDIQKLEENAAVMEFIDVEEANHCLIAMAPGVLKEKTKNIYTHCEIHPSSMFSVYTSTIPLCNHNQAPRNIFSGAQGKQAIGVYATNFNSRIDTLSLVLHYPQKSLVQTRYSELLNMNALPNGENVIVAVATYTGYNQEDSIILNKSSVERGMFNLTYFKSYISEEDVNDKTGTSITFGNPNTMITEGKDLKITKYADYSKLDEYGFPKENEHIMEDDAIVGKCKKLNEKVGKGIVDLFDEDAKRLTYTSAAEIADKTTEAIIDKVHVIEKEGYGKNTYKVVKIRMRKMRIPEYGDKLASRHGQKGVCGMIIPAESMPFSKDGIVPDIIVNPHAFPSRMTIGHLLECVMAKGCTIDGQIADATPFEPHDFDKYGDKLENNGYERHGDEILYNGYTGEQIPMQIFFGPTYYFRLKHMVGDKINYRVPGRVMAMTKQPTKGRGNDGGLRMGEMETNCVIAHGMSAFIKESFTERSDKYSYYIDNKTGHIANVNIEKGIYNGHTDISQVKAPFAFKLFTQELEAMSVTPKMLTDNSRVEYDDDGDDGAFDYPDSEDEEIS